MAGDADGRAAAPQMSSANEVASVSIWQLRRGVNIFHFERGDDRAVLHSRFYAAVVRPEAAGARVSDSPTDWRRADETTWIQHMTATKARQSGKDGGDKGEGMPEREDAEVLLSAECQRKNSQAETSGHIAFSGVF